MSCTSTHSVLLPELTCCSHEHRFSKVNSEAFATRPLQDAELESAITSLEASAVAIEEQCRILEGQKRALQLLKQRNVQNANEHHMRTQRHSNIARQNARLDFETSELLENLHSRLNTAQSEARSTSSISSIERILERDDRMFDGLQKLLHRPGVESLHETAGDEVEVLCDALSMLTAEDIRPRLDTGYSRSSNSKDARVADSRADARPEDLMNQRDTLAADLNELVGEIEGLAAMTVDAQYRTPMQQMLSATRDDSHGEATRYADYAATILEYLTLRVDLLSYYMEHTQAHRLALQSVLAELAQMTVSPKISKQQSIPHAISPSNEMPKGLKPLRLVQANFVDMQDPAIQLLRTLDVRLSEPGDTGKVSAALDQAVRERQSRTSALSTDTERLIASQLASTLRDADEDIDALLSALYSHSHFASLRLDNGDADGGLHVLERTTQRLGDEMRNLNIDELGAGIRRQQRIVLQRSA